MAPIPNPAMWAARRAAGPAIAPGILDDAIAPPAAIGPAAEVIALVLILVIVASLVWGRE